MNKISLKNLFVGLLLYKFCFKYLKLVIIKCQVIYLFLKSYKFLLLVLRMLKTNMFFYFRQVMDIYGRDLLNFKTDGRFDLCYVLLSMFYKTRVITRVTISLYTIVNTSSNLFLSSNGLEREVYDMFGIFFFGHTDLRRILTDYGFLGYPLRKDFPLTGFYEIVYEYNIKAINISKLVLSQDYRDFCCFESVGSRYPVM